MPVDALSQGGGDGGGWGMPNIALPPAPGPPEQPGIGAAAGQVDQRQIDLSVNFHGPVGSDPDECGAKPGLRRIGGWRR